MDTQQSSQNLQLTIRGKIAIFFLAVFVILGFSIICSLFDTRPADVNNTEKIAVTIVEGSTANDIILLLKEEGIIRNETAFKFYLKRNNFGNKLRTGDYLLSPAMSTQEIVYELLNGIGKTRKFTVPEGYTLRDIAASFAEQGLMTEEEFWSELENGNYEQYTFLADAPDNEHKFEGFLFPDTYVVAEGCKPDVIIHTMLKRFQKVWDSLPENTSGLTSYELVVLASMVEAEAKFDSERADIASVYINRLAIDMPMQCDATILYGMPERKKKLYFSDYEYQSEYNTYLYKGLPPTPICNPGEQSLIAASQPAETEYLYYLWNKIDNDGHVFAKTHDGHLKNRAKYGY